MLKPVAVIGFYGSGKTETAKQVAQQLHMPYTDLSAEIERLSGMRIATLYARCGDMIFQKYESLALSSVAASGGVVSTTSGCVALPYNRRILADCFITVYLNAPLSFLQPRIEHIARPTIQAMTQQELSTLYEAHRPFYEEIADHILDATLPTNALSQQIVHLALANV